MALGKEKIQRIRLAGHEPELELDLVQRDNLGLRTVDAAQVDRELLVDEDPHVVVTGEREPFAAAILEQGVRFQGEVKVVPRVFLIAEEQVCC